MRTLNRFVLIAVFGLSLTGTAGAVDCRAFPKELLDRWGLDKQLVLNLALTRGRHLETMRGTTGLPDPATFRALANAFERADFSGIEPPRIFDGPEVIAEDLHTTADLLGAALATGGRAGSAWARLSNFYTQRFYGRHNSSITWWLNQAGCA